MERQSIFPSIETSIDATGRKPILPEPREKPGPTFPSQVAGIFAKFVVNANGEILPAERLEVKCAG
jgi:hypothetical protein